MTLYTWEGQEVQKGNHTPAELISALFQAAAGQLGNLALMADHGVSITGEDFDFQLNSVFESLYFAQDIISQLK